MQQVICLSLLAALLTGCVAPGAFDNWRSASAGTIYVLIKSDPDGATITFQDGTECETPCRVGVAGPLEMTVARAGYAPQQRYIDRNTPSPLMVRLDAVGRTTPIEEVTLPDL